MQSTLSLAPKTVQSRLSNGLQDWMAPGLQPLPHKTNERYRMESVVSNLATTTYDFLILSHRLRVECSCVVDTTYHIISTSNFQFRLYFISLTQDIGKIMCNWARSPDMSCAKPCINRMAGRGREDYTKVRADRSLAPNPPVPHPDLSQIQICPQGNPKSHNPVVHP